MRMPERFFQSLLTSAAWWIGVALSLALYLFSFRMVESKAQAEFDYKADTVQLAIRMRVHACIDVLRGVAALFDTSNELTPEQFHSYVARLDLDQRFPGITNLAFVKAVPAPGTKAAAREPYHVLTYLEPVAGNPVLSGLDIGANAALADALAVSRDTGEMAASGKLVLASDPDRHIGITFSLPLYRRGMPSRTAAERRAAYYGLAGAGVDLTKLMAAAVGNDGLRSMRVRIFDAGLADDSNEPAPDPAGPLYDSGETDPDAASGTRLVRNISMRVGPRVWEAEFSANKAAMVTGFDAGLPWLVLALGLTASLLLYGIYYFLLTARKRAMEIAGEMTKDLRASERNLAEAQHMANLGSWILEPVSGKMSWSAETYRIFGLEHFDAPRYGDFLRRVHEEDRKRIRDGLDTSVSTGADFTAEHRIVLRDGTVRWVHIISRLGYDARHMLLRGTIMDITERKETLDALKRSQDLLRDLTAHQDRIKEDERKRIAREIHDELGQTLLALRIDVSMLEARTGRAHPRLNARARAVLNHLDATVKTIRTIINNLRPAVLDLGLSAAIEWQVAEFRRRTGIPCELFMDANEFALDDTRATTLFRILQESLSNIIRHANASRVIIELHRQADSLVMTITDDGVGILHPGQRASNAFGLVGIEERILALNGKFAVDSARGQGTTLTIFIPLEADAGERADAGAVALMQ